MAASNTVLQQVMVRASGGRYNWSIPNVSSSAVKLLAGTDIDDDGYFCGRGDACGAYPVLGSQLSTITLSGDTGGLNFTLSPTGAVNAGTSSVGTAIGNGGWKRIR